jgi:hypothetical protein
MSEYKYTIRQTTYALEQQEDDIVADHHALGWKGWCAKQDTGIPVLLGGVSSAGTSIIFGSTMRPIAFTVGSVCSCACSVTALSMNFILSCGFCAAVLIIWAVCLSSNFRRRWPLAILQTSIGSTTDLRLLTVRQGAVGYCSLNKNKNKDKDENGN